MKEKKTKKNEIKSVEKKFRKPSKYGNVLCHKRRSNRND